MQPEVRRKLYGTQLLSGVTEPIGALFCFYLIKDGLNPFIEAAIMSFCWWNYGIHCHFCFDTYEFRIQI